MVGGVGWLQGRGERVRERMVALLLAPNPDSGWQLAVDLGRPAVPLLWELVNENKSNRKHRLLMLSAAVLAGGVAEDERLLDWLAQQKPMLEERVLAAMMMALGPDRTRAQPEFWARCLGPVKTPEHLLGIAVRLAAVRFPGAAEALPVLTDEEPGLCAAAAFAGVPVPVAAAARWSNLRSVERHADLFWRGQLLGAARRVQNGQNSAGTVLDLAREVARLPGERFLSARAAAIWLRARADDLQPEEQKLDWSLLQVATGDLATGTKLRAWLGPVPMLRDEAPHRLAVAYALSRPVADVMRERASWSSDPAVAEHIAVALAMRLCGNERNTVVEPMPGVAAWQIVRWLGGAEVDRSVVSADPVLASVLPLLAEGRLGRRALRVTLEETLWRWGSHPGLACWQLERSLVRDLLLAGSSRGGSKYLPHIAPDQRYMPTGLDRNDEFFTIAVALFDFLMRPRLPIPAEHRLPG